MKNKDKNFGIVTLRLNKNDWEIFKELCRLNNSDASKEMRKFIKNYIAEHSDKIKDIVMKRGKNGN